MARYDFPLPFGWFDVGLVDETAPGELKEIHVFGAHLMLWRGADGAYHLQEMTENGVDGAHFVSIHRHPAPSEFAGVEFEDYSMVSRTIQEFPSSQGPVPGTLDSYAFGMGTGVIRYKTLIEITMMGTTRPIDTETSLQRFRVYYKNPENDPKVDRIAAAFNKEVNRQVQEDIPIWNKKVYKERPILTEGEAPITRFRSWAKRFYVEKEAA